MARRSLRLLNQTTPFPVETGDASDSEVSGLKVPTAHVLAADRLKLIICPSLKKPKKARTSKRKLGKKSILLDSFVDLPQDIVLEISSYTSPVDLLNLSRVSKRFRSFFMSQDARALWIRVLRQEAGLPECPDDLSHPQYASLVFEKFCMACLSPHGRIEVKYGLRLRLCVGCSTLNIAYGFSLVREHPDAAKVFSLVPSESSVPGKPTQVCDSANNGLHCSYYLPEVLALIEQMKLQERLSPTGYGAFVKEKTSRATRMMNEGISISAWKDDQEKRRLEGLDKMLDDRREKIYEKMKALGWEEKYFPPVDDEDYGDEWHEHLLEHRPFTTRNWNMIRPAMEFTYRQYREYCLVRDLLPKVKEAHYEYRKALLPVDKRRLCPTWPDFCDSEAMSAFISEHYEEELTPEAFAALMSELERENAEFPAMAQAGLVRILERCFPSPSEETLSQARALFSCECFSCSSLDVDGTQLFGYPAIVDHWLDSNYGLSWNSMFTDIQSSRLIVDAAERVLEALEMPKNASQDDVERAGKLFCNCGHRLFQGPLEFNRLAYHVECVQHAYRGAYDRILPTHKTVASALIVDTHGGDRLKKSIGWCKPAEEPEAYLEPGPDPDHANPSAVYCRHCYVLTSVCAVTAVGWRSRWHMKNIHGKEFEGSDIMKLPDMLATYGRPQ